MKIYQPWYLMVLNVSQHHQKTNERKRTVKPTTLKAICHALKFAARREIGAHGYSNMY